MKNSKIIIGILSLSLVATLGVLAWLITNDKNNLSSDNRNSENQINSFQECVDAGNPVLESFPRQCKTDDGRTFVEEVESEQDNEQDNTYTSNEGVEIIINEPNLKEAISSPLKITGEAPGNWSFEANFPIVLTDWDGKIIAEGYATMQGDWMTEEYVPFEGTIEFQKPNNPEGTENIGSLILQKSNPSGLAENDDAVEISIKY